MRIIRGVGAALFYMTYIGVTFAVVLIITTWYLFHNPPEIITDLTNKLIDATGVEGAKQ